MNCRIVWRRLPRACLLAKRALKRGRRSSEILGVLQYACRAIWCWIHVDGRPAILPTFQKVLVNSPPAPCKNFSLNVRHYMQSFRSLDRNVIQQLGICPITSRAIWSCSYFPLVVSLLATDRFVKSDAGSKTRKKKKGSGRTKHD
jgi:hypothetical protein